MQFHSLKVKTISIFKTSSTKSTSKYEVHTWCPKSEAPSQLSQMKFQKCRLPITQKLSTNKFSQGHALKTRSNSKMSVNTATSLLSSNIIFQKLNSSKSNTLKSNTTSMAMPSSLVSPKLCQHLYLNVTFGSKFPKNPSTPLRRRKDDTFELSFL